MQPGFLLISGGNSTELKEINKEDRTIFKPQIDKAKSDKMFKKWEQAVEMSKGWVLQNSDDE